MRTPYIDLEGMEGIESVVELVMLVECIVGWTRYGSRR